MKLRSCTTLFTGERCWKDMHCQQICFRLVLRTRKFDCRVSSIASQLVVHGVDTCIQATCSQLSKVVQDTPPHTLFNCSVQSCVHH